MNWNHSVLRPRSLFCVAGGLILALACSGCEQAPPRPADPTEGRKVLQSVLDAWKGGSKPDALAQQSPSIQVADQDWTSGLSLADFKLDDEGKIVGADAKYSVKLELKDPAGKVTKKTAVYAVATQPKLVVLRQED